MGATQHRQKVPDEQVSVENLGQDDIVTQENIGQDGTLTRENLGQDGTVTQDNVGRDGTLTQENLEQYSTLTQDNLVQDGIRTQESLVQDGIGTQESLVQAGTVTQENLVQDGTVTQDNLVQYGSMTPENCGQDDEIQSNQENSGTTGEAIGSDVQCSAGQSIEDNRPNVMQATVKAWRKEKIYTTKGVTATQEKILSQDCVCVVGVPGAGKSTAIHHAALCLEDNGFIVYCILESKELLEYFDEDKKQVFIFDDVLGIYSLDLGKVKLWDENNADITCVLGTNTKLLVSIRTQLYNQAVKGNNFVFLDKSICIDFSDDTYRLDWVDMRGMLKHYLTVKGVDKVDYLIRRIWSHTEKELKDMNEALRQLIMSCYTENFREFSHCFPLLCKVFSSEEILRDEPRQFFTNPFQALTQIFQKIKSENELQFCGLVLCTVFDGKLTEDMFSIDCEDNNESDVNLRDVIMKAFHLEGHLLEIKSALNSLDGVYVTHIENTYQMSHRVFHDLVTYLFNDTDPSFVLKYGTKRFIHDRIRISKTQLLDPYMIIINDNKNIQRLADRMIRELMSDRETAERMFRDIMSNRKTADIMIRELMSHRETADIMIRELMSDRETAGRIFRNIMSDRETADEIFRDIMSDRETADRMIRELMSDRETVDRLFRELMSVRGTADELFRGLMYYIETGAEFIAENTNLGDDRLSSCLIRKLSDIAQTHKPLINELFIKCMEAWYGDNIGTYKLVVFCLQSVEVDCNVKINCNYPLHLSAMKGSLELTQLLLQHGADKRRVARSGDCVLHRACNDSAFSDSTHRLDIIKLLIQDGDLSVVKFITRDRRVILEILEGDVDSVCSDDSDSIDSDDIDSVCSDDRDSVDSDVIDSFDSDHIDRREILEELDSGNLQLEEVLSDHSIKVLTTDKHKMKDYVEHSEGKIQLVIRVHDNILTHVDHSGRNILHYSADNYDVTKYLLQHGADKRRVDRYSGDSILHYVCSDSVCRDSKHRLDVIKLLIQDGDLSVVKFITSDRRRILQRLEGDIDSVYIYFMDEILEALYSDNVQLEEVLSDHSFKVLTTDKHKMKDYVEHSEGKIQLVIRVHDNILTYVNHQGRNILHYSVDDYDVTEYLLRFQCLKSEINRCDRYNRSPYWYVVNDKKPGTKDIVIENKEDMKKLYTKHGAVLCDSDSSEEEKVEVIYDQKTEGT